LKNLLKCSFEVIVVRALM